MITNHVANRGSLSCREIEQYGNPVPYKALLSGVKRLSCKGVGLRCNSFSRSAAVNDIVYSWRKLQVLKIQIWKLKKGVSYLEGDPNYDLYQLSCRVTAKRFFPNFLNLDSSFNHDEAWDVNDPKRYEHEVATIDKYIQWH